jgi:ankyrin repeat protein
VVKYLLQKGHDPDTSNLLAAVRYDCPEIVRLLFNLPQMDWTVNDNMLLTWACGKGCFDIVQTILPRGEHKSRVNPAVRMNLPIREATARGHLDIVQYLLADPRVDPSECSNAAIISAAERNYLEVVRCLVRHPKVDPSDNDNLALQLALKNGHREVAELLGTDARVIEVKSKPPNIHPL